MIIYKKEYYINELDINEVLRYAGVKNPNLETQKLLNECVSLVPEKVHGKVCYVKVPVIVEDESIDFDFFKIHSKDLQKNLSGCHSAVIFAATVGFEFDKLIKTYGSISPSKALFLQSIGTECVEKLCDLFNKDINVEQNELGNNTAPRFSPGYGDLPLELQKEIFNLLNCEKNIGVFLNESLLMTPSKSVTAIIGIKSKDLGD